MTRHNPTRPNRINPIKSIGPGILHIAVHNAGVVVLWPFLPRYFETLGLVRSGQFVDPAASQRAMYLVYFLATGVWAPQEPELVLAKLMCGLPIDTPVVDADDNPPTEQERALSNSLLHAVMQSSVYLKDTSVDALRKTLLMRDGSLRLDDVAPGAGWELFVQRTVSTDPLIDTLPWSPGGPMQFSWMPQPLLVRWETGSRG
ncbi:contractile injection system tape measure protein [Ralstonia soli]|uniref:Contractile injection system tape measure protein n=1 Tax=Ralstonia soli TaxID=2953896 RepID=A0ABT1AEV0_9RALS|nr:contractile injection system tape measure protein [Ralstonia soli]MCO5396910.1 contractile injection system tape measure protein [Ralstonia soli]